MLPGSLWQGDGRRRGLRAIILGLMICTVQGLDAAAMAGLLGPEQDRREIRFDVVDGKPMIPARVAGQSGRMMFDIGTPEALFLNRGAVALGEGQEIARGKAASGQAVIVWRHAAPEIEIAGQVHAGPAEIVSGDFGFAEIGLGEDFLGFAGLPLVADLAFSLDYGRRTLILLRTDAEGRLPGSLPERSDIVAQVVFAIWPGEQPTTAATIGSFPILLDFDTGDSGTLYLRPETQALLENDGSLRAQDGLWRLDGLRFGGAAFDATRVNVIRAGGPEDFRTTGQGDFLRLGARFFADHPSLWNFPAGTITILRPESPFLTAR